MDDRPAFIARLRVDDLSPFVRIGARDAKPFAMTGGDVGCAHRATQQFDQLQIQCRDNQADVCSKTHIWHRANVMDAESEFFRDAIPTARKPCKISGLMQ